MLMSWAFDHIAFTCLCVETLDIDPERLALVKDIVKVFLVQRGSKKRVSKHARCQCLGISMSLSCQGLGRFYMAQFHFGRVSGNQASQFSVLP